MLATLRQSYSANPRLALGGGIENVTLSSQALATGKRISHAWQDATGLAIGSNMQAIASTLDIVLTSIVQSQQVLEVAQTSVEQMLKRCNDTDNMLARAKSGVVTNDLIINALSTAFSLTKQEMIRIAQDTEFNGVKLLNGTGGIRTKGISSKVAATPNYGYDNAEISLNGAKFLVKSTATTDNAEIVSGFEYDTVIVSGGNLTQDSTNPSTKLLLTDVTLTFPNAKILADGDKLSCRGNVTVSGLSLELTGSIKNDKFTLSPTGIVQSASSSHETTTTIIDDSGGISGFGSGAAAFDLDFSTALANSDSAFIDDINTYYPLTGGKIATSTFKFVTGSDLINSQIKVILPNMRLDSHTYEGDAATTQGLIGTLNTDENTLVKVPDNIVDLNSKIDADNNVPLIKSLRNVIITQLDNIGAQQQRFRNIVEQLSVYTEAMDAAQGVFLNADLAKTTEDLGRNVASISVIISALQNLFSISSSIAKLVTG